LGDFTEIIPANTINHAYDIHYVNFEASSTTGIYELHLFYGIVGQEILIAKNKNIERYKSIRNNKCSCADSTPIS